MTISEIRGQYLKAVAEENKITTPDQLISLLDVAMNDIKTIPGFELQQLFKDIRRDSGERNAKAPKEALLKVGGA
jgi:hypothetical protein